MNSFIVCYGEDNARRAAVLIGRLASLGIHFRVLDQDATLTLLVGGLGAETDDGIERFNGDDCAVRAGVFAFKDDCGSIALRRFYRDFDPEQFTLFDTRGTFALVVRKNGVLSLFTDELGTYKIYHDSKLTVFSNLFIAVAEAVANPIIDVQACYEYAWNGGGFGERTFFCDIATVRFGQAVLIADGVTFHPLETRDYGEHEYDAGSFNGLVDIHLERCRALFHDYVRWFGDRITLSFSGGYDSRLMLALLLDAGARPHLFTYGSDQDEDCRIALGIAEAEGLTCEQVDKDKRGLVGLVEYKETFLRNYAVFDGWKNTGLFDTGADATDRAARVDGGLVKMNGGGGEIYRNFFYLLERSYSPREVVWSFYSRYMPTACTRLFDLTAYERVIADTICVAIGASGGILSRREVELVYPLFRNRYWTARVQSENHAFGPCVLPFLEPSLVQGTCDVPIRFKSYGCFEGAMIKRLNPRLASHRSAYGYSFSADPPLKYWLKAQLSYRRPPKLRRYSYRIQHRVRQQFPYFLTKQYLQSVIDVGFPYMSQLFRIEAINDPEVFNRIATIEYLCQRISARAVEG